MQIHLSNRDRWTVLLLLLMLSFERAAQSGAVPLPPHAAIVCLSLAILAGGSAAVLMLFGAFTEVRDSLRRK